MSLSQTSDEKAAPLTASASSSTMFSGSTNNADEEQKLIIDQTSRFDKFVNRSSSWKILFQCVSMTPSVVILLYLGIKHIHDCPVQPLLSIFLIVTAGVNLVNVILLLTGYITAKHIKRSSDPSLCARYFLIGNLIIQLVILVFSIGWLIAGQIWVFGTQIKGFQTKDHIQTATFCHSAIFWNAFVTVILTCVILLIIVLAITIRIIIKRRNAKRMAASSYEKL